MSYSIKVSKEADKVLRKWQKSNPQLFRKYQRIYIELAEHPRTGTGHPEPLIKGQSVTYSRHITARDRIIYDIEEELIRVLVLKLEGHYKDK